MGDTEYQVKTIAYGGKFVPIIMQNENGPCPLIALCNVLLLRGKMHLPSSNPESVSFRYLANTLSEAFMNVEPATGTSTQHMELALDDCMALLPTLQAGLDVNVRFQHTQDFEYTANLTLFDLLRVRLLHGWIVSPDDKPTASVLRDLSYNHLVELVIEMQVAQEEKRKHHSPKSSPPSEQQNLPSTNQNQDNSCPQDGGNQQHDMSSQLQEKPQQLSQEKEQQLDETIRKGLVAEEWLNTTAGQLTYTGLQMLHEDIHDDELVVFFRNNHFSTATKHNGHLYLLLTDVGYTNENDVWESLGDIDGDSYRVNSDFKIPGRGGAYPQQQQHQQHPQHHQRNKQGQKKQNHNNPQQPVHFQRVGKKPPPEAPHYQQQQHSGCVVQ
eukprot:TRINITY_DN63727_c0_g1_i1.p2 TRINITY_DN63727_c0_g1~~TRINITY_DN63727_c0_g1_i1.p2  ORF type:complete len:398 (-),score=68.27 TRINITY_DN63727_c0_g1_i1:2271-3419(-)